MLSLDEILEQYPPNIRHFKRYILKEYFQYVILDIIFNGIYADKLTFIGGTALRLIYNNSRFSEDLDFDNFNLSFDEFEEITKDIQKQLGLLGFVVEIKNTMPAAYRCKIRIPEVLYQNDLSGHKTENIAIHFDTQAQSYPHIPDKKILNKFGIFTQINVTPISTLLAQKFVTAFSRHRPKGRDFYDIIFLLSLSVEPDYRYLSQMLNIDNKDKLKEYILTQAKKVDFEALAKDVELFLFFPSDRKKVLLFVEYLESW